MKRRHFLLSAAAAGGALVVGWGALPPRGRVGSANLLPERDAMIALNAWVRIADDGSAVLAMPRVEMGQGVHTALPMLLAEELRLPLTGIRIEQPPEDTIYGNVAMLTLSMPFPPAEGEAGSRTLRYRAGEWMLAKIGRELGLNVTGGSSSVADAWDVVRLAGATARQLLVEAAARRWRVPSAQCVLADGIVSHPGGHSAPMAAFASDAAGRAPEASVQVTPREAWRVIGRPLPRTDVPSKTDGSAIYGIDVRPTGLRFAAVRMCPVLGGDLARLDTEAISARPGVLGVVRLPPAHGATGGFAVIAADSWTARRAADAAAVEWAAGPGAGLDGTRLLAELREAADRGDGHVFRESGDVMRRFAGRARVVEARYEAPWLAHAAMEPINATAQYADDRLTVWAPTQVPGFARKAAIAASGLDEDSVTVHVTLLGGGFGRRLEVDVIAQAVRIAMAMPGSPVQTLWSREQDTTHDFYRPAQAAWLAAALDPDSRLVGLRIRSAGDAVVPNWLGRNMPILAADLPDKTSSEGLFDHPYAIEAQRIEHVRVRSGVPVGNWRSVGHSHNAFFLESFIDEIAAQAGADPLAFRRGMLTESPRHLAVLELAAERAGWDDPPAPDRRLGIALHESFGSIVAQVAEVGLDGGRPRVHRVVCAIDCGTVVNPGIVAQQVEGSVVFGLTAALHGRIDIASGRVRQDNFPSYPLLTLAEAPRVETHIVTSTRAPAGVGEPATPPIAPAVANALFALTGRRLRRLPLDIG